MKLVSAILPTRGRPAMARQALDCFLAQTYREKELIILDDIEDPSFPIGVPAGYRILRFMGASRLIPEKRNQLCELAAGEIIAHFDSDDWSAPNRLEHQVELLDISSKSVTGYSTMLFYDGFKAHKYHNGPHYAVGTSLTYRKDWWSAHRFLETKRIAEDNEFVQAALVADQLITSDCPSMMVARIHSENTATKHIEGWQYKPVVAESLPEGFPRW